MDPIRIPGRPSDQRRVVRWRQGDAACLGQRHPDPELPNPELQLCAPPPPPWPQRAPEGVEQGGEGKNGWSVAWRPGLGQGRKATQSLLEGKRSLACHSPGLFPGAASGRQPPSALAGPQGTPDSKREIAINTGYHYCSVQHRLTKTACQRSPEPAEETSEQTAPPAGCSLS